MEEVILKQLKYLQLNALMENWDNNLKATTKKQPSYI